MNEDKAVLANGTAPHSGKIKTDVASFDNLIGQVFTHTELLGLPDRQLAAYKASLRQMFWGWYNGHMDNPTGLADPSKLARIEANIEPNITSTTQSFLHTAFTN